MEAEVINCSEEEQIIGWIFDYACKLKIYGIIHEILLRFPALTEQGLSHIRLALAAVHKIVNDEDVENYDLALTLIKEIQTHSKIVSDRQYKQLTYAVKVKSNMDVVTMKKLSNDFVDKIEQKLPLTKIQKIMLQPPSSSKEQTTHSVAMQQFEECLSNKNKQRSHDDLLELVKLLCCHGDSAQKTSEELTDSVQSCSVLTGRAFVPVKKSVASEQICVISSSSDSDPLTNSNSDPHRLASQVDEDRLRKNSSDQEKLSQATKYWSLSSEENNDEGSEQSSIEDIFVQPSDDESSSLELFPHIKVEKKFGQLCVVKLHKDENLSGSIRDAKTNRHLDIYR